MSKSGKRREGPGPLASAAAALEAEIERFEALVEGVRVAELGTEKQITRTAKGMGEALESQQRIASRLGELVAAVNDVRTRQERGVGVLADRTDELKARRYRLDELLVRYSQLGAEGAQINTLAAQAGSAKVDTPADATALLKEPIDRMGALVEKAAALARDAGEAGFVELHRQADAMKSQVAAARNKLVLLERTLLDQADKG